MAVDCGIKLNIVRSPNQFGLQRHRGAVYHHGGGNRIPKAGRRLSFQRTGDPADVLPVIRTVRGLRGRFPIFGICLGHQLISLAYGAETYKLKFGHRGGNHPVMNPTTGKVEMTSQNHSYAVRPESLEGTGLTVTHRNLLDDTVEGVACPADSVFLGTVPPGERARTAGQPIPV